MSDKITNLDQLRTTAVEVRGFVDETAKAFGAESAGFIGAVAEAAADAIKALDNKKQDAITGERGQVVGFGEDGKPVAQGTESLIDDTLTKSAKNILGVTIPVKGMNESDYDALPQEEKDRGLVLLLDTEGSSGSSSGSSEEVYSTEETRIGTWVDGKPLYRKVTVSHLEEGIKAEIKTLYTIEGLDTVASLYGNLKLDLSGESQVAPLPMNGMLLAVYMTDVSLISPSNMTGDITITSVIEYTKTTD